MKKSIKGLISSLDTIFTKYKHSLKERFNMVFTVKKNCIACGIVQKHMI